MHFDQNAFGQRVKHFRNKRGLTLEQMSTALNISIDHLSRIELGKRGASIDLILDIADTTGYTNTHRSDTGTA